MLGGLLALFAAATFALNNACLRRGTLTGTAAASMAISLGVGLVIFAAVLTATGFWGELARFSPTSWLLLCVAGVVHFAWGRYCNFRATKAMGANLVGPPQQAGIILTLALAIVWLGETLTPLRIIGIALILLSPLLSLRARAQTAGPDASVPAFQPKLVEGYTFAVLSAIGFGASPILVRTAIGTGGIAASIAAGFVAYASAAIAISFWLLGPKYRADLVALDRNSAKWFGASATLVSFSQMATYMAIAVAPVSVVVPIQRLALVFRVFTNAWLNPKHEVLGGRIWAATIVGLIGACALSVSTDFVLAYLSLPPSWAAVARWQWPVR